jgi:hypothetical protein
VRTPLVIAVLALTTGCSMFSKPQAEIPKQPDAPTNQNIVENVGKDIDKVDGRVAAAVAVARENAEKPEVVKAETGVALSYLPAPSEADVAFARQRAGKADQKDYKAAEEYGKKLLAKINADWASMEAQQKEAKRVSDLKDKRIEELTQEVVRVKQEASNNVWTMTGAGLAVIGALTTAFMGPKIGLPILLCGAFCGSIPFIIDSPYFEYIAAGTLLISAGLGLWWLTDKVRDSVNKPTNNDPHDEATPKE